MISADRRQTRLPRAFGSEAAQRSTVGNSRRDRSLARCCRARVSETGKWHNGAWRCPG